MLRNCETIGNTSAFANDRNILVESFAQSAECGLASFRMRIGQIPRSAVAVGNFHLHAWRQMFLQMRARQFQDFRAILIRDEPKSQLRHCFASDHGLRPLPLITAADSIYFRSRAAPDSFRRAVAFFAEELGHPCFLADFLVDIDRQFPPRLALPIFKRLDSIVETFDRDVAVFVMQGREQSRECGNRVLYGAAENA